MEANNNFAIAAKTCTLQNAGKQGYSGLLESGKRYVIPIYQRPYAWTDVQIRKFMGDLFTAFRGLDGQSDEEPMFIGTMQLSFPDKRNEQEVIDGQQRLTTLLLLLVLLRKRFPECRELAALPFDWLTTRVNSGEQQRCLDDFLKEKDTSGADPLNVYTRNSVLLAELLDEQLATGEEESSGFTIDRFVSFLLNQVYFVVIETRAVLSKTLRIFNAINATGLDLNGSDVFKIRMYEYLRDLRGRDESAFDDISNLYALLDTNNAAQGARVADMQEILAIYQLILIAQYDLPVALYSLSTDSFFERLFDTILNVQPWEHFKGNAFRVELSVEALQRIIAVRFDWETYPFGCAEDACMVEFIDHSRYGRYTLLKYVLLYRYKDNPAVWEKCWEFNRLLGKLYFIYSVRFQRAVNEIHTFTYGLLKALMQGSWEEVLQMLHDKIGQPAQHSGYGDLGQTLNGNIAHNTKLKNLLCRLSAMLDEDYRSGDPDYIAALRTKLFHTPTDIEHIQAYHDRDGNLRHEIWDTWKEEIHSLGNLIILEQDINRSIGNALYGEKRKRYASSQFNTVRHHAENYPDWSLPSGMERKEKEVNKVLGYLFG